MLDKQIDLRIEETIVELAAGMEVDVLLNFGEVQRYMLKKQMQKCEMTSLPEPIGDGLRASGECVCETCGQLFFDHPDEWRRVGFGEVPFLNILCDGTLVKL
jgi:hypothetical protein